MEPIQLRQQRGPLLLDLFAETATLGDGSLDLTTSF
jgi:hypothetical protein